MRNIGSFLIVWLCCGLALTATEAAEPVRRPNIVLILVDDFGYECVGANGGTSYRTPQLDRLAASGVRFEHCYAQPLCTPTRVQLMTGIYNVRNYTNFGEMNPGSVTFANLLKDAGYATAIAGKWQLGKQQDLPAKFGFDEHCLWQHTRRPSRYRNPGLEINGREVDYTGGEYGPDVVQDWALDFIDRHKSQPFFLYYPMMLTHGPFDPTPNSDEYGEANAKKGRGKKGRDNERFGAMVEYLDKLVGKLVAHLEQLELRDDTLILLLGDNGTAAGIRSRLGDRVVVGGKGSLNHAGMHVPLIASWPGKVAAGNVNQNLIDTTDFLPTICAAAGVKVPEELAIDGHTFWPQLQGEKGQPRDWYYCWYAPRRDFKGEFAANQRFKLYRSGKFYDLANDPDERRPLPVDALKGPAVKAAKTLAAALKKYEHARPKP